MNNMAHTKSDLWCKSRFNWLGRLYFWFPSLVQLGKCVWSVNVKNLMLWNLSRISRWSPISLRVFAVFLAHFYWFHVCFVSDWIVCILQREDLAGFGRLILTLACGSAASASLEFMASHYSPDLVRITQALLASSPEKPEGHGISTIRQLYPSLAERMFGEVCAAK